MLCCWPGYTAASSVLQRETDGGGVCDVHHEPCLKPQVLLLSPQRLPAAVLLLHKDRRQSLCNREGIRVSEGVTRSVRTGRVTG